MLLNRRNFARTLAVLGGGLMTRNTAAGTLPAGDNRAADFAQALAQQPWLLGYQSVSAANFNSRAELSGQWPAGLRGALYRNGPARHQAGTFRYRHWFDGDGLMQMYTISGRGVSHRASLVQTRKLQAETRAGRAMYPAFGSVPPDPAAVSGPDDVNVANISVLHHHNKLLALWEAGSPYAMQSQDLQTEGVYEFAPHADAGLEGVSLQGVPFSAHPRVEADGNLWNFGYVSNAGLLVLWHIDPAGRVVKLGRIAADPITMVHDLIVTRQHLVLLLPPLHYRSGGDGSFLDAHQWQPRDPTRVLVVDKNDFAQHYWLELPAQWVFHFGNGWEDEAGVIRFDGARADDPGVMLNTFTDIMRGKVTPAASSHHHQYRIDTRARRVSEAPMFSPGMESEFPVVDPRVSCRRNRQLVFMSRQLAAGAASGQGGQWPGLNAVSTFDYDSGARREYVYPQHQLPEEHLLVPAPDSRPEAAGWIVGTALDWQRQQTLLNVFDSRAVDDGPIASARLPYALPLGLHGKFVTV